jgi:hypothetical protein
MLSNFDFKVFVKLFCVRPPSPTEYSVLTDEIVIVSLLALVVIVVAPPSAKLSVSDSPSETILS